MAQLIKFSDSATIGIHAMMHLAAVSDGNLAQIKAMASAYEVSEAHLSKVMQRLGKAGLVRAVRGPLGGYALRRPAGQISLLQVYEAIDGEFRPSSCLFDRAVCSAGQCDLGGFVCDLQTKLRGYLAETTVAAAASAL